MVQRTSSKDYQVDVQSHCTRNAGGGLNGERGERGERGDRTGRISVLVLVEVDKSENWASLSGCAPPPRVDKLVRLQCECACLL